MIKLTIVIPIFNEGAFITSSVNEIMKELNSIENGKLLLVNDGSTDDSLVKINALVDTHPNVMLLNLNKNCGYGGAIKAGYLCASKFSSHILFMDSDLTNSPKDIKKFYKGVLNGYNYIKATRFEKKGGMVGVPLYRQVHSLLGSFVARLMFGLKITDPTNGFRLIKVGLIDFEKITNKGFASILDELYLISNSKEVRYLNIPVVLTSRDNNQRNSSFVYSFETYKSYLKPCILKLKERIFL